jgi:hypothetical protein
MTRRKYTFVCAVCGRIDIPRAGRNAKRCAECFAAMMQPEEMVRRYQAGEQAREIARAAGVSDREVFYRLKLAGVKRQRSAPKVAAPRSPMTTEQMAALRDAGRTVPEIAKLAGITSSSVYARLATYAREQALGRPLVHPTLTIDEHTYTERLGCEGRIVYAADAEGHVWQLEPGRKRVWYGRRCNWERSTAARRIAAPRTTAERITLEKYSWRDGIKL